MQYSVRVEEDINGLYQKGDVLTFFYNEQFAARRPRTEEGMWFVMPVEENPELGRCISNATGTFYVVEDGYTIPAFEEEKAGLARSARLSGRKVEDVMDFLRDL